MSKFVLCDELYRVDKKIMTKEYADANFIDTSNAVRVESCDIPSNSIIKCVYSQLFKDCDSLVFCNDILEDFEYLELKNGKDYDEENDTYSEIYQWYIVDSGFVGTLLRHTEEIIYYHNRLNIYVLGVTHFGAPWRGVNAEWRV